eukprot:2949267-Prymnesium_polylepis.1
MIRGLGTRYTACLAVAHFVHVLAARPAFALVRCAQLRILPVSVAHLLAPPLHIPLTACAL